MSSTSSPATFILNTDTLARSIFIFMQALMQNEVTKSGQHTKGIWGHAELKREINEQVRARGEQRRGTLIRQSHEQKDSRRYRRCRVLKRLGKLL